LYVGQKQGGINKIGEKLGGGGNPEGMGGGRGGDKLPTPSTDQALNVNKKIAYSHLIRD